VKTMQPMNSSLNNAPATDWQILGELELPISAESDGAINAWLTQTLFPMRLHADFLNKVLKSAQHAVARMMLNEIKFGHIHLLIFAPVDRTSRGQTWGFFRIEKIENPVETKNHPHHTIEFYLYVEE
jgi:hypothetical protein